ncbi:hypothetical protein CRE_19569 [Caenorhabditis remanei]|uniref:Uncharacterized protein n=1 Tax=Caenorhabditis remanei TaxID=31234 RepID=E3NPE7_CAERE|nr:hypothetical protein CRE_19569 [Caenorhabditis remanei]
MDEFDNGGYMPPEDQEAPVCQEAELEAVKQKMEQQLAALKVRSARKPSTKHGVKSSNYSN